MKDIEIAQKVIPLKIDDVAQKIDISLDDIIKYGDNKAKINVSNKQAKKGKLVLVTALTPTPAGEGKSTVSIGLVDGLNKIGERTIGTLREPSMGPVFGIKGGATGGGYTQVIPMEEINLHFTGDMHAITSANNLVSAAIDNHIFHGNALNINPDKIVWERCLDVNDRSLRDVSIKINNEISYSSRFVITVATEMMAVLCLSKDMQDFKEKIGRAIVAYRYDGKEVTIQDLNVVGSLAVIMKDALKPNLVQTLEGNPVLIHGGPFANIAHGCNSVIATNAALDRADYVITEAGFGSDLGAEKFINIKSRMNNLEVSAIVLVVTIKALKHHGGVCKEELHTENLIALETGLYNLNQHVNNINNFKVPLVVTLNKYHGDTEREIGMLENYCKANSLEFSIADGYAQGGEGMMDLAKKVVAHASPTTPKFTYDLKDPLEDKITKVVQKVYGGKGMTCSEEVKKMMIEIDNSEYSQFPICIAKTPNSLSDMSDLEVTNRDFNITVRDIKVKAGAGFIVVYTGNILTMPGLGKHSAYEDINYEEDKIVGLF